VLVPAPAYHPAFSRRCDGLPSAALGLLAAPLRHGSVRGVLLLAEPESASFGPPDQDLLGAFARQAAIAIDNARQRERSANFFTHTSEILVSFLEALDVHHPGHSRGVAALADLVTRRLGLNENERRTIHYGALLHDIGKIRLRPGLLSRGDGFGPEAQRAMRDHTRLGVDLLQPIGAFEDIVAIVKSHHERWDGKGYPAGLKGEAIPLGGRVVAVADAFDAMGRQTPYRDALSTEAALRELEAGAGTQFDPRLVRLFVAAFRENGDPREGRVQ
jgi:putative nucleotidyltransferase with HDIG domain